jgi:hypothetical protein
LLKPSKNRRELGGVAPLRFEITNFAMSVVLMVVDLTSRSTHVASAAYSRALSSPRTASKALTANLRRDNVISPR